MNRMNIKAKVALNTTLKGTVFNVDLLEEALKIIRSDKRRASKADKERLQEIDNAIQSVLEDPGNLFFDQSQLYKALNWYFVDTTSIESIFNHLSEESEKKIKDIKSDVLYFSFVGMREESTRIKVLQHDICKMESELEELQRMMQDTRAIDTARVRLENNRNVDNKVYMIHKKDRLESDIAYLTIGIEETRKRNERLRKLMYKMDPEDKKRVMKFVSLRRNHYDGNFEDIRKYNSLTDEVKKISSKYTEFVDSL